MTESEIQKLEALANAVQVPTDDTIVYPKGYGPSDPQHVLDKAMAEQERQFIAASREAVPELIAEIKRYREVLEKIERMKPFPDHATNTITLVAARTIARQALGKE